MADLALAEAPMADLPFKAVRLKLAKKPRKVRHPNPKTKAWVQCRSEDKHGYKCGKWFKGNNMLDRHVKDCHEGMLDGDCLGCGRSFKTKTALRCHCQHVCTPSCLPTRHIPKKGKEALLWQTLLAEPAELQEALLGEDWRRRRSSSSSSYRRRCCAAMSWRGRRRSSARSDGSGATLACGRRCC